MTFDKAELCLKRINYLITHHKLPIPRLQHLEEVTSSFFIALFNDLFNYYPEGTIRFPEKREEEIKNAALVLNELSKILSVSLNHIKAKDVIAHELVPLTHLLELFDEFSQLKEGFFGNESSDAVNSESSNSLSPQYSKKDNLSLEGSSPELSTTSSKADNEGVLVSVAINRFLHPQDSPETTEEQYDTPSTNSSSNYPSTISSYPSTKSQSSTRNVHEQMLESSYLKLSQTGCIYTKQSSVASSSLTWSELLGKKLHATNDEDKENVDRVNPKKCMKLKKTRICYEKFSTTEEESEHSSFKDIIASLTYSPATETNENNRIDSSASVPETRSFDFESSVKTEYTLKQVRFDDKRETEKSSSSAASSPVFARPSKERRKIKKFPIKPLYKSEIQCRKVVPLKRKIKSLDFVKESESSLSFPSTTEIDVDVESSSDSISENAACPAWKERLVEAARIYEFHPRQKKRFPVKKRSFSGKQRENVQHKEDSLTLLDYLQQQLPGLAVDSSTLQNLQKRYNREMDMLCYQYRDVLKSDENSVSNDMLPLFQKQLIFQERLRKDVDSFVRKKNYQVQQNRKRQITNFFRNHRLHHCLLKKYYEMYQIKLSSRTLQEKSSDELLLKHLYEAGMNSMKKAFQNMHHILREQKLRAATEKLVEIKNAQQLSNENISELLGNVKSTYNRAEHEQEIFSQKIHQVQHELRNHLKLDIENLHEKLVHQIQNGKHFRELDAQRIMQRF